MHWHTHKVSAKHFKEYKKLGKECLLRVALGGDPYMHILLQLLLPKM
jgi:4-hydroxy-3-polyprenylbenzoate decarboxylase